MATHKGSEGTVKVGANAVAEIRSYSITETSDTLEDTVMGDAARTYLASLKSFSGSMDVFWDETDTNGQIALSPGSSVTINIYPEGSTSGDTYYTGSIIVTEKSITASFDGMVEASISFQGNGALSETTV
jgi:predicted secreted protein